MMLIFRMSEVFPIAVSVVVKIKYRATKIWVKDKMAKETEP